MLISRHVYDTLREEKLKAEAANVALQVHVAQLIAHLEWLQVRFTQSEFERASLVKRYMNVDVPIPTVTLPEESQPDPNATLDFGDIGDDEAARLGLEWAADGTVRQMKK